MGKISGQFICIVCLVISICFVLNKTVSDTKEVQTPSLRNIVFKLNYSHSISGVRAHKDNMYITKQGYKSNLHPQYSEEVDSFNGYQLATYFSAGEIARRYNARYLIDIGCGKGGKIATFRNEFHVIGVDYGVNLDTSRSLYPAVTFLEANFDVNGSCKLDLHPDIISQAVVISADVIEHIVDPLHCYTKYLKVRFYFSVCLNVFVNLSTPWID